MMRGAGLRDFGEGADFFLKLTHRSLPCRLPYNRIMELPEELLLVICEHLQPPRYEDEAALFKDYDAHRASHRSAAAVKMVSRGLQSLMTRTARVVRASDYQSWDAFVPRTVNGTGHTDPSEFCATSI